MSDSVFEVVVRLLSPLGLPQVCKACVLLSIAIYSPLENGYKFSVGLRSHYLLAKSLTCLFDDRLMQPIGGELNL